MFRTIKFNSKNEEIFGMPPWSCSTPKQTDSIRGDLTGFDLWPTPPNLEPPAANQRLHMASLPGEICFGTIESSIIIIPRVLPFRSNLLCRPERVALRHFFLKGVVRGNRDTACGCCDQYANTVYLIFGRGIRRSTGTGERKKRRLCSQCKIQDFCKST